MEQEMELDPIEPARKSNTRRRNIIIGCVALALLVMCGCIVASAATLWYFAGEPEGLEVQVDYPWTVQKGDQFNLTLSLCNWGTEAITVNDIDLDAVFESSFLDGMVVEGSDPKLSKDYTVPGIKTFIYNRTIEPGEVQSVTFHLLAIEEGAFGGDIAIYVGDWVVLQDVSVTVLP